MFSMNTMKKCEKKELPLVPETHNSREEGNLFVCGKIVERKEIGMSGQFLISTIAKSIEINEACDFISEYVSDSSQFKHSPRDTLVNSVDIDSLSIKKILNTPHITPPAFISLENISGIITADCIITPSSIHSITSTIARKSLKSTHKEPLSAGEEAYIYNCLKRCKYKEKLLITENDFHINFSKAIQCFNLPIANLIRFNMQSRFKLLQTKYISKLSRLFLEIEE